MPIIDYCLERVSRRSVLVGSSFLGIAFIQSESFAASILNSDTALLESVGSGGGVRPETFGAVADGKFDCTEAFNQAVKMACFPNFLFGRQRNRPIILSSGVYRVNQSLVIDGNDIAIHGPSSQNCALVFTHMSGDSLVCAGANDSVFSGFSIDASADRRKSGIGRGLVIYPGAKQTSSIRTTIRDVSIYNNPGDGLVMVAPEGARLENVNAIGNTGHGCVMDCSHFEDINNLIDFSRFSDNGKCGLVVKNVTNSIFNRVECLNNKGFCQFNLTGHYNIINCTDCEGFDLSEDNRSIGLEISGKANIVQTGVFYKLINAIKLSEASYCKIILPKIEGTKKAPTQIGIWVQKGCSDNNIELCTGNFIDVILKDDGLRTRKIANYS